MLLTSLCSAVLAVAPAGAGVEWYEGSLDDAVATASAEDKTVLVYFWWDGSQSAKQMLETTFEDKRVQKSLKNFVCFNGDHARPGIANMFQQYNVQIGPTTLFLNGEGQPEEILGGAMSADQFLPELERIKDRGEGTVSGLRAKIAKAKKGSDDDVDTRMILAGKLQDTGDQAGHDETLLSILDVDPEGRTFGGCQAKLMHLNQQAQSCMAEGQCGEEASAGNEQSCGDEGATESCGEAVAKDGAAKNMDLSPYYAFAKKAKSSDGRFLFWSRIADLEVRRGQRGHALDAIHAAMKLADSDESGDWHNATALKLVALEGEPSAKEKKLAMQLAETSLERIKKYKNKNADLSQEDFDGVYARRLATLASAQAFNGKTIQAKATLRNCMDLSPSPDFEAQLASLEK